VLEAAAQCVANGRLFTLAAGAVDCQASHQCTIGVLKCLVEVRFPLVAGAVGSTLGQQLQQQQQQQTCSSSGLQEECNKQCVEELHLVLTAGAVGSTLGQQLQQQQT
jgi:hypothetical protein